MRLPVCTLTVIAVVVTAATPARAQDAVDGFAARTFTASNGIGMPYRLFLPELRARRSPLPIIVYLHGGNGRGTDNLKQISGGNTNGTHVWTTAEMQARHPAFVLAPQLPDDKDWGAADSEQLTPHASAVLELLTTLSKEFSIDANRVYVTGQSLGGRGTWDLISKRPELFAAAVPLCGDGNAARVVKARALAIWAFHGAKDAVVPVTGTRELITALKAAGSSIRYTEYPDAAHNVWTLAYPDPELAEWLFAQRRSKR